jgi:GGDEF domain-containing protein
VARLGGDEFVVLCAGRDLDAGEAVRRLEAAMADSAGPGLPPLRASIGVALYRPGDTVDGLVATADAAMYVEKAKHHALIPLPRQDAERHAAV